MLAISLMHVSFFCARVGPVWMFQWPYVELPQIAEY